MGERSPETTIVRVDRRRRRSSGARPTPTLSVIEGPELDAFFALPGPGRFRVGRAAECEVRLDNSSVSRVHAHVEVVDTEERRRVRIVDAGSTNGLRVNGVDVADQWLMHSDKIELGRVRLRFEFMSEEELSYARGISETLKAARRDPLTGLLTRSFLGDRLDALLDEATLRERPICCVLLDLDDFKQVNDRFGHRAGDAVLVSAAGALLGGLRKTDFAVRYGGEEFLVVLPDSPLPAAMEVGERLRERIFDADCKGLPAGHRVTASAGVAERKPGEAPGDWFARADEALYQAKGEGKNRVQAASAERSLDPFRVRGPVAFDDGGLDSSLEFDRTEDEI